MSAKSTTSTTEQRALDVLLGVLPRGAKVTLPKNGADLVVGGQSVEVKWVGDGSLGEVRRRLESWSTRPGVVAARRLSPGARELLSVAGIGWVDETGAAEIALDMVSVSRSGQPPKAPERPGGWTPAVIAVSEALLCGARATVAATEEVTGLSTGSCTYALKVLADLGLLEASARRGRRSARRVADPAGLLDTYSTAVAAQPLPVSLQVGITSRDPVAGLAEVGRRWDRADVDWAATGIVAASVIARYIASVSTADVYIDTDTIVGLEAAAAEADLRPIEGGRLILRPFPTVAVHRLARMVEGLRVAPWPRVYVDLLAAGVRGEEAAEHLREVIDAR